MIKIHLGIDEKLRNGGRFGIPSTLIKNIKIQQGDLEGWQGYLDLLMEKKNKDVWDWFINIGHGQVSYFLGVGRNGIDYAALTYSSKGKYMPITLFLYETPNHKLNLYWPRRGNTSIDRFPIPVCSNLRGYKRLQNYSADVVCDLKVLPHIVIDSLSEEFFRRSYPIALDHSSFDPVDDMFIGKDLLNTEEYKIEADMNLMVEDFEHRVGLIPSPTTPKTIKKPKIGGKDIELLIVHPDAEEWLDSLFKYKTKGVFTGLCADGFPIYQFNRGILYEETETGRTDRCVERCENWDYIDNDTVSKIRSIYPNIQPCDIFISDED